MKKYSSEARELLSSIELFEIKAGKEEQTNTTPDTSCTVCATCIGCSSSCTACVTKMLDVIVIP